MIRAKIANEAHLICGCVIFKFDVFTYVIPLNDNNSNWWTMAAPILSQRDLEFMIYELFEAEKMLDRPRYQDHDLTTFNAAIETAKTIAEKYFLPILGSFR